ncbi:MAG: aminotransferase class IV, partial [Spirochaetales bacterium]|nr:aminotransferase class IV [Spirochaetales bacterium]
YVDGNYVDENEAMVSVKDIVVLRGFGVFDFMRTYNRVPFYLEEHVDRLFNSAKYIGLDLNVTREEICDITRKTIEKNPEYDECNVRIVYTGGISSNGVCPEGKGKLIVMVTHKHDLPAWWYEKGAKIVTVDTERYIPEAKSTNYLSAVVAQMQAEKQGAIEAVYVDRNDRVLEGTTTNFFGIKNGKIYTPDVDILPGITRSVILNLLKGKYEVIVGDIKKSEISSFDEIFITASNKEIVPVITVDDTTIGSGKPGSVTKDVMKIFADYCVGFGQGRK